MSELWKILKFSNPTWNAYQNSGKEEKTNKQKKTLTIIFIFFQKPINSIFEFKNSVIIRNLMPDCINF